MEKGRTLIKIDLKERIKKKGKERKYGLKKLYIKTKTGIGKILIKT